MKNVISNEVKLNIAIAAIKTPSLTREDLAVKFSVSKSTVGRAVKAFSNEATLAIKAEENAPKPSSRSYKPRNGRWAVLNKFFDEVDIVNTTKKPSELYKMANDACVSEGLKPLAKTSYYAMASMAKKARIEKAVIESNKGN